MTRILTYFVSVILLFSVNAFFPALGAAPNLLFLFAILYAFKKDDSDFLWLAFFSGLIMDVFSGAMFGTYMLSFLMISFAVNYATRNFFSADPNIPVMFFVLLAANLFLVALIYLENSLAVRFGAVSSVLPGVFISKRTWIDIAFNLVLAFPVYLLTMLDDHIILQADKKHRGLL